jgi:large subunit ribosomal protein L29
MRLRRLSKEEQAVKAKEMQNMSSEELTKKLGDLKEELFNLRFQHAINQLDNPHRIDDVKKDIARVMTVMRQKNV